MPDMYTKLYSHSPLPNVYAEQWSAEKNWIKLFSVKKFANLWPIFLKEILSILKQYVVDLYYVSNVMWGRIDVNSYFLNIFALNKESNQPWKDHKTFIKL